MLIIGTWERFPCGEQIGSYAGMIPGEDSSAGKQRLGHISKQGKSLTDGSRTLVYGKNDPFRSWPISANELEEVAMGSETNV